MAFPLQISAWSGVFYLYSPGCISSWRGVNCGSLYSGYDCICIGSLFVCFETQHLTPTTVEVKRTTEKSYMESKTNCYILSAKNTRQLFSISVERYEMGIFGGWGQLWKISYVKVGHAIPHSKGLRTHNTSVKSVFSNFYPYAQGTPKYIDIGT